MGSSLPGILLYSGKLSQIGEKYDFHGENFRRSLAFAVPKDAMPPNFLEKTFANSHKTAKVFLPRKFSLYGILSADCRKGFAMCFIVLEHTHTRQTSHVVH